VPKPVGFVITTKDKELSEVSISGISWAFFHDYPNWTSKYISGTIWLFVSLLIHTGNYIFNAEKISGPIKVPFVLQTAHKLAELSGNYDDDGDSMNSRHLQIKFISYDSFN